MAFWTKQREEAPPGSDPGVPVTPAGPPPPKREEPKPMAMLKRDDMPTSAGASGDLNALLGRGSEFEGKLTFEGTVRIDGKFNGQIVTNDVLVVGEGAKLSAEVTCGTIIVHGEVTGNIKAKTSVELHTPAKVRGNITTPSLMVEKGVMFEGQTKMENLDGTGAKVTSIAPNQTPAPAKI
jgi:cytoskeletal protein CcmA (bactofilin family)